VVLCLREDRVWTPASAGVTWLLNFFYEFISIDYLPESEYRSNK
jgi:hypothetical protein